MSEVSNTPSVLRTITVPEDALRRELEALIAERNRYKGALERIAEFRHTWGESDFEEAQEIAGEALDGL